MKSVLYYFTGTGNTLAVARKLAQALGDTTLLPLRRMINAGGCSTDADVVGIAFPVYYLDMPGIVRQFAEQIQFTGNPYVYAIASCGERPGGALFRLQELLAAKGTPLSAGFALVMPENYIGPVDLMQDRDRAQEKYACARRRIPAIAAAIRDRQVLPPEGENSLLLKFGGRLAGTLATSVYNTPRRFHATGRCNRCGTCGRICPTRNITVTPEAVRWDGDCTQCYACIHWCPEEAIEIGGRTAGKPRYHHPDVTIKDMLDQRGGM
jgi:ferredoxin